MSVAVVVSAIFNLATLQRSGRQFQLAAFDVAPFSLDDPPDRSEFERTARAALLVVDVYRRISGHAFAINMLTDDRGNTARVNRIHQEISADRREVEATLEPKTRAAPSEAHIEELKQRQAGRRELVEREQADLVAYCLTKWAPLTR